MPKQWVGEGDDDLRVSSALSRYFAGMSSSRGRFKKTLAVRPCT